MYSDEVPEYTLEQAGALFAVSLCTLLGNGSSLWPHSGKRGKGIFPVQVV